MMALSIAACLVLASAHHSHHLRIFSLLANVADVKSLVIHPATTTHSQLSPEELEEQHIYPSTVRLSIGIENIDDLIEALDEAFTYVK
jgi:O-acetylhomoserine (thiol)-lyase